ncbi:TIGR03915 family putative DNA repair protein [Clostridium sp. 'deep sea']|uniref:TIGR03915 family putative DNA repair protein n=1 Tax=Clostridium sp. 'deep sea' TaxID=2779445 RepID=UPI0018965FA2|nr:TIGR03915 family putative DNA repair protein [Clostridium sp. 'deep sea']QOR33622.1 TIGR03915 family putative DNA repair protein [Clostridium sp. 'deep sea']
MIYTYDGSFDGFLTCIFQNYYFKKATAIYNSSAWQMNILEEHMYIKTDEEKAQRVYKGMHEHLSEKAVEEVFYTFLAKSPQKENCLLNYLRLAFKMGVKIDNMYTHAYVLPIREIVRKVSFEKHRIYGLLRFKETGNFLYADYAPDNNITGLITPFFADRFSGEKFIIHDIGRNIASFYAKGNWYITEFELQQPLQVSKSEETYSRLWQQYFETAAIESRINPNLQRKCMPRRYWRFLTEMQRKQKPFKANITNKVDANDIATLIPLPN